MSDKKPDDASKADNEERHNAAAPPGAGTGTEQGGKPKVNVAGTPEIVPGPEGGNKNAGEKPKSP